jgi:hypothetical protein
MKFIPKTDGLARADNDWTPERAAAKDRVNARQNDNDTHFGLWAGACKPHHGLSRSDQFHIVTQAGGEVYTREVHDFAGGSRVTYRIGVDKLGIEMHAFNVELVAPIANVDAPKTAPRKAR